MAVKRRKRRQSGVDPIYAEEARAFRLWMYVVALFVLANFAYSSSFTGVFVADDETAIVTNQSIRSLTTAFNPPRDTTVAGRPVLNFSFALNYATSGLDPRGYHALNLAIHLAAGLVLLLLLERTPLPSGAAFVVALFWTLHPMQTAAVTYVVQRAESLMGLFFLVTVYAAGRADDGGRWGKAWMIGAVAACALGMATKEVMVVAPVVVALWLWILKPGPRLLDESRRPLLTALAATWIVLVALVAMAPRGESVGFTIGGWTPISYLWTQAQVIVHYIRLAILPTPLVFMYSWPPAGWLAGLPYVVFLGALLWKTISLARQRHPLALPGIWFFLILAPSSSVLPIATEVAAEHRMYLPLAAVLVLVVVGYRRVAVLPQRGPIVAAIVAIIAVGLATNTYSRNHDYQSIASLMRDNVEDSPENLRARVIYGGHLLAQHRYVEAEAQLRVAVTLPERTPADKGLNAAAYMYLGSTLGAQGKYDEALPVLERTIALSPQLGEAHAFLGNVYASKGRLAEAAASFERAIDLMPPVPALLERAAAVHDALAAEHVGAGRETEAHAETARAQELLRRAQKARASGQGQ